MEENINQFNSEIMINVGVSVKNVMHAKKIRFGSIIDHSAITCDWIIVDEETKTITINFNEEKVPQNLYILLTFIN